MNPKEEHARCVTETTLRNALFILADAGFLMELAVPGSDRFAERLKACLTAYRKSILLPSACMVEWKKHALGSDSVKAEQALFALSFAEELYCRGQLSVHGDSSGLLSTLDEGFADPFLKNAAFSLFQRGNVLVLTQDNDLCWDLLTHRSVRSSHSLIVKSVSPYGWLKNPAAFYDYRLQGGFSDVA